MTKGALSQIYESSTKRLFSKCHLVVIRGPDTPASKSGNTRFSLAALVGGDERSGPTILQLAQVTENY